ncbi:glycoside hydrolase family 1 protein [Kocuria sp.]|uniref:glycoside hydrolase family 1 protein n=1 Tax=Kocuria sp. TaxID=1871328 RepID=UPI0026E08EC6|nr:family 1 glycosylhydrolase [Kocuria sp.]MDO5618519.1 family 1 glycosylhydrolase [Kocuria sp.]
MTSRFPATFLWGAATAAHQVEGNNTNSDVWFLENLPHTDFAEPSGAAIEHYDRYREDIALLAGLGFNTYRFSLEWSRIEPEEGQFSPEAISHYRDVLLACRQHGLTTVVTLFHFTSPRWLLHSGGWESEQTVEFFERYSHRVMRDLGDLIDVVCTINEPNLTWLLATFGVVEKDAEARARTPMILSAAQELGVAAQGLAPFLSCATERSYDVVLAAHRAATRAVKSTHPDTPTGWTLANSAIHAAPGGEQHAAAVREEVNLRFLRDSRGDDFVGIQNYGRTVYAADGLAPPPPDVELDQMGREIYPDGLAETIREAAEVAQIPVMVTENGMCTDDDAQRLAYLEAALRGVAGCLTEGVDVRGYMAWSAFDNYEWTFGYGPKFGIIAVDRHTQQREPKPSARWLGQVSQTNGSSL